MCSYGAERSSKKSLDENMKQNFHAHRKPMQWPGIGTSLSRATQMEVNSRLHEWNCHWCVLYKNGDPRNKVHVYITSTVACKVMFVLTFNLGLCFSKTLCKLLLKEQSLQSLLVMVNSVEEKRVTEGGNGGRWVTSVSRGVQVQS